MPARDGASWGLSRNFFGPRYASSPSAPTETPSNASPRAFFSATARKTLPSVRCSWRTPASRVQPSIAASMAASSKVTSPSASPALRASLGSTWALAIAAFSARV
jgi:hypothetical protein